MTGSGRVLTAGLLLAPLLAAVPAPTAIDFEGIAAVPDGAEYFGYPGFFEDQGVIFSNNNSL